MSAGSSSFLPSGAPPRPPVAAPSFCAFDDPTFLSRLNGANYRGSHEDLLPSGSGEYLFSNGTIYRGNFVQGEFHGPGTLFYPNGSRFVAQWENGKLMAGSGRFFFPDNLPYGAVEGENLFSLGSKPSGESKESSESPSWPYCSSADRRYWSEIQGGISINRQTQLTDRKISPPLPYGSFDVGCGYLLGDQGKIYHYNGLFNREAGKEEIEWAKSSCRIGLDPSILHIPLESPEGFLDFKAPKNQYEKK